MASRMVKPSGHDKIKRAENLLIGCLWLLCVSVGLVPRSAESFQCFDLESSPFLPRTAPAKSHQDATTTIKYNNRMIRSLKNCPHSMLESTQTSSTCLSAHSLTTALEGLWEDRVADCDSSNKKNAYKSLLWINLDPDLNTENERSASAIASANTDQQDGMPISTLPLYPLSEVYLPMSTTSIAPNTIVNHTLNNVEPQNIKMALDLLSQTDFPPRFCVVLRAMDTGRIASVGNIFKIVDADVQKVANNDASVENDLDEIDKIMRIRLTCKSEGLAEIIEVENGFGWGEKRLLRSDEYLRAKLRPWVAADDEKDGNAHDWQDAYQTIRQDIRTIKLIYQLQLGSEDYPPDTLLKLGNEIQDFPELDPASDGDTLLWNLAQEWQSVCMTLRQGRQALLSTERNERMVDAAFAKGGPLKLPIHLSDLDPESRQEIQELDYDFQLEHEESGMDPTLDFQVLIGLPTTNRRFDFLSKLVARERLRLESIASSSSRKR